MLLVLLSAVESTRQCVYRYVISSAIGTRFAEWKIEKLNLDVLGIKREETSYIHVHVPVGHDNTSD